jgi:hypothetical protein
MPPLVGDHASLLSGEAVLVLASPRPGGGVAEMQGEREGEGGRGMERERGRERGREGGMGGEERDESNTSMRTSE